MTQRSGTDLPVATPPIIAMTGRARAGKDTVAARLVSEHGFTRVAFADGVREAALALDPIIRVDTDWIDPDDREQGWSEEEIRLAQLVTELGWDEAKSVPEVRRTLQRIGSEAGWMIHGQNLWIDLAAVKVRRHLAEGTPVVITDMRFPHEASWLDEQQRAWLWLVQRPDNEQTLTGEAAAHASESGELGREPDLVIENDADLDALHAKVDQALAFAMRL